MFQMKELIRTQIELHTILKMDKLTILLLQLLTNSMMELSMKLVELLFHNLQFSYHLVHITTSNMNILAVLNN